MSGIIAAMHSPVWTSTAVNTGVGFSLCALMYAKSTCTTGCLLRCGGWFVVRPLPRTQIGHQVLYGRCVRLCSCTSCGVGMYGVVAAFALIAGWCSSSSDSSCSLYCAFSSKFVEPVHCVGSSGCGSAVQLSSTLLPLLPFVGYTIVILVGRRLS